MVNITKYTSANRLFSAVYRIITLLIIGIGWVLFRSNSLSGAKQYIQSMFGGLGNPLVDEYAFYYAKEYIVWIVFAVLCCTPVFKRVQAMMGKNAAFEVLGNSMRVVFYIGVFLVSISYLAMGAHNPFIYFNF